VNFNSRSTNRALIYTFCILLREIKSYQTNPPNEQTSVCKVRSCGEIFVCCVCSLFACCLRNEKLGKPLPAWIAMFCLLVCSKYLCVLYKSKMSLQTVFKYPAKLYTLKNFPIIYVENIRKGVLFLAKCRFFRFATGKYMRRFHQCAAQDPCNRRTAVL